MTPTPLTPLTDDELATLERLEKEATPGPWFVERLGEGDEDDWYNVMSNAALPWGLGPVFEAAPVKADAHLAATVRGLLPRPLPEVRARRAAARDATGAGTP